jgi:hypothetical protein
LNYDVSIVVKLHKNSTKEGIKIMKKDLKTNDTKLWKSKWKRILAVLGLGMIFGQLTPVIIPQALPKPLYSYLIDGKVYITIPKINNCTYYKHWNLSSNTASAAYGLQVTSASTHTLNPPYTTLLLPTAYDTYDEDLAHAEYECHYLNTLKEDQDGNYISAYSDIEQKPVLTLRLNKFEQETGKLVEQIH